MSGLPRKGRPFHLLTDDQWQAMKDANLTWKDVAANHPQPKWCGYPGALDGGMGCWSLVGRMVTGKGYCCNCDCKIVRTGATP